MSSAPVHCHCPALHAHAIQSILQFLKLPQLAAAVCVSPGWTAVAASMPSIGVSVHYWHVKNAGLSAICMSPLSRHVSSLHAGATVALTAEMLTLIRLRMPQLHTLSATMDLCAESSSPFYFPLALQRVNLRSTFVHYWTDRFKSMYRMEGIRLKLPRTSMLQIEGVMEGLTRCKLLQELRCAFEVDLREEQCRSVSFAPLARLQKLRAFAWHWRGYYCMADAASQLSDAQLASIRSIPALHDWRPAVPADANERYLQQQRFTDAELDQWESDAEAPEEEAAEHAE